MIFQYPGGRAIAAAGNNFAVQRPDLPEIGGREWAGVVPGMAQAAAMRDAAQIGASADMATAGIGATTSVLNTGTNAFAQGQMAGLGALTDMAETEAMYDLGKKRINAAKPDNFSRFAGTALGLGQVGLGFHMMNRPTPQIVYRSGGTA